MKRSVMRNRGFFVCGTTRELAPEHLARAPSHFPNQYHRSAIIPISPFLVPSLALQHPPASVHTSQLTMAPRLMYHPPRRPHARRHAGLPIDAPSRERMRLTEAELVEERDLALQCLAEKK